MRKWRGRTGLSFPTQRVWVRSSLTTQVHGIPQCQLLRSCSEAAKYGVASINGVRFTATSNDLDGFVFVANVDEFVAEPLPPPENRPFLPARPEAQGQSGETPLPPICKTITIDETKSITVYKYNNKFYASNAKCPHQGGLLGKGFLFDITDMGIVWSTAVQCPLHNWSFDLQTGACDKSLFVLDIYKCKEVDGKVYVATKATNEDRLVKKRERRKEPTKSV